MGKIILPNEIFGRPVKGAMERILANPEPRPVMQGTNPSTTPITPATNINDPENYLILPGKKHGSYEYPDLLVGMHRLGFNQNVEQAARQLGLSLQDTAKEYDGKGPGYIGNIQWKPSMLLNLKLGGETLNPRQHRDFVEMLISGNASDGKGKRVPKDKLDQILDEIMGVRNPWRAEWLDADFKILNKKGEVVSDKGELHLLSRHILQNGVLVPTYKANIEGKYLASDSQIDATSFNEYGLATKVGTDFYQWFPRKDNNSVARFCAYSGRAVLGCDGDPDYSDSGLGVRHVRKKI